jgi:hypothetical protein
MRWAWLAALVFLGTVGVVLSSSATPMARIWGGPAHVENWKGLPAIGKALQPIKIASSDEGSPRWVGYYRKAGGWVVRVNIGGKTLSLSQGYPQDGWTLEQIDFQASRPVQITLTNTKTWTLKLQK